jgi:hypothetical protein
MGALFESIATQLGNLGGSYSTARDQAAEQRNRVATQQFEINQRLREFAEQQKVDELNRQVQQSLMKSREDPDITLIGNYHDPKTDTWYRDTMDRRTGKVTREKLEGEPEAAYRTELTAEERAKAAKDARDDRFKMEDKRERFKLDHPSLFRSAAGSLSAVPNAIKHWYEVSGGAGIDHEIGILEVKLRQMDILAYGAPEVFQHDDYKQTVAQLSALYDRRNALYDQAAKRVPGAAQLDAGATGGPAAGGGSSHIVVTEKDVQGR